NIPVKRPHYLSAAGARQPDDCPFFSPLYAGVQLPAPPMLQIEGVERCDLIPELLRGVGPIVVGRGLLDTAAARTRHPDRPGLIETSIDSSPDLPTEAMRQEEDTERVHERSALPPTAIS